MDNELGGPRPNADASVSLLGRLVVSHGDQSHLVSPLTSKGIMLSMLASRCNEPVRVDELVDAMWADGPPKSYRSAVQVTVVALRDVLEPHRVRGGSGRSVIVGYAGAYELRLPAERIDGERFARLVGSGQRLLSTGAAEQAARSFREALAMWGEPFVGADCPALRPYVERLRMMHRAARSGLSEADVQLGREELSELQLAVDDEPFDERRWGHLMIALFRRGRQAEALSAYQQARTALIDVGVEPGQYLRRVEQQVLLQDGDLLGRDAPARTHHVIPTFPAPPRPNGPLLRRDDEVRAVAHQIGRWRIVTIVGPPGVGKTTLATEVARTRAEVEVAWVSLGDIPAGSGAMIDVSLRLGVFSEIGADADEYCRLLTGRIGDRPLLLVLDNVEHVIESASTLVSDLARSCPNLSILLTSRRPLGLPSEQVYRLLPFGHENIDDSVDGPSQSAAVHYLIERAGLGSPDEVWLPALQRIAAHVGGLALGLEQAAACLHTLTPVDLAERLDLIGEQPGLRSGMARAISWSLALLEPEALGLLRALSHLDAAWPLDRAEGIGRRLGIDLRSVPRVVSSLVEHSLVIVVDVDDGPAVLHRIIEPVRQFVRTEVESASDGSRFPLACAECIAEETAWAGRLLEGEDQAEGLARLHALMPEIRRTVMWAVEHAQPVLAAQVLAALRGWWWASGLYADGQVLHGLADPIIKAWVPTDVHGHALRLRAVSARVVTHPGFAAPALHADSLEGWFAEAVDVGAPLDVRSWIAQLWSSGLTFDNRDSKRAEELAIEAIDDATSSKAPWLIAWGRYALAIARARTDPLEGLSLFEQAISAFEAAGDQLNAARVMMFLGHGTRIFGDARGSDRAFAQAEQWCANLGAAPVTQLDCELGRAQSADAAGSTAEAAHRYRSLIPRLIQLGDHRCAAVAQRNLAAIVAGQGDLDGAGALVSRAMETFRSLDTEETELAATLLVRAEIAELREQWSLSARLLGQAMVLTNGSGVPMELRDLVRLEQLGLRLADQLGSTEFDVWQQRGRTERHL